MPIHSPSSGLHHTRFYHDTMTSFLDLYVSDRRGSFARLQSNPTSSAFSLTSHGSGDRSDSFHFVCRLSKRLCWARLTACARFDLRGSKLGLLTGTLSTSNLHPYSSDVFIELRPFPNAGYRSGSAGRDSRSARIVLAGLPYRHHARISRHRAYPPQSDVRTVNPAAALTSKSVVNDLLLGKRPILIRIHNRGDRFLLPIRQYIYLVDPTSLQLA